MGRWLVQVTTKRVGFAQSFTGEHLSKSGFFRAQLLVFLFWGCGELTEV